MKLNLFVTLSSLTLGLTSLIACNTSTPEDGERTGDGDGDGDDHLPLYECTQNTECGPSEECSGGSCFPITTCVGAEDCSDSAVCFEGICRAMCTSEADCSGLACDTVSGICMPATNPTGTGGVGGDGDGDGDAAGGSPPVTEPTYGVIDDMEDGDAAIYEADGRIGPWYTYREDEPRPIAPAPTNGTGYGDSYAIHAVGTHVDGVSADGAYGGISMDLNNTNADNLQSRSSSRQPYDASAWDGIEFKIRSDGVTKSIRFEVVTQQVASVGGGTCSGDGCSDAYGKDVVLSDTWTTVKVPYSSLVQEGWGQAKDFDPSKLMALAWEDLSTEPWDYYLDDVKFYKEAPIVVDPTDPDPDPDPDPEPSACGDSWGEESNGSITWYTFDQGTHNFGDINCSYGISSPGQPDTVNGVTTGGGQYFAAINTADYNQAAACGACVEITRDGGATVTATVVDQCPIDINPKCVKGHIDLSKAAFLQLAQEVEGYVGQRAGLGTITWKYVSCPVTGNVKLRLKEANNANWNMVIVENHPYPIKSLQIFVDGAWLNASREEYNFWIPPGGRMGQSPYQVRATDINDNVIEGSVALGSGSSQDSGDQFMCQ